MNYQTALAGLIIFGSVSVYAEVPKLSEQQEVKVEINIEEETTAEETEADQDSEENMEEETTEENEAEDSETKEKGANDKSEKKEEDKEQDLETLNMKKQKEKLALKSALRIERLKNENADLLARLQKIKWEKQEISEELELDDLKRQKERRAETQAFEEKALKLSREAKLAKEMAAKVKSELSAKSMEWDLKTIKLNSEIEELEAQKERDAYIASNPVYLDNPLTDDNTLVISDRRISLNGPIVSETADYITTRINYYNNKNNKKPIFIVIDSSPGGSVMAGYRILKAMDGSKAPVYVVVKSYAASMAATIITLAKKSFAYPNAIMLHHQMSSTFIFTRLNLTQEREHYEEMKEWWERIAAPLAKKMGITLEEFTKLMYKNSSDGDWSEFASDAQKLHWVDHIVERIEETSLLKDPNTEEESKPETKSIFAKATVNGRPVVYLPRLSPKDMYFLYNPDQYYQMK